MIGQTGQPIKEICFSRLSCPVKICMFVQSVTVTKYVNIYYENHFAVKKGILRKSCPSSNLYTGDYLQLD